MGTVEHGVKTANARLGGKYGPIWQHCRRTTPAAACLEWEGMLFGDATMAVPHCVIDRGTSMRAPAACCRLATLMLLSNFSERSRPE
ncbi:unnamed protein product [Boreogadus saida]